MKGRWAVAWVVSLALHAAVFCSFPSARPGGPGPGTVFVSLRAFGGGAAPVGAALAGGGGGVAPIVGRDRENAPPVPDRARTPEPPPREPVKLEPPKPD
ncbi:MAG: hypothetical protein LBL51_01445, partial [Synergistaceae bacterium]|nr:hypothetical protein [Synergistaceae bacterium]